GGGSLAGILLRAVSAAGLLAFPRQRADLLAPGWLIPLPEGRRDDGGNRGSAGDGGQSSASLQDEGGGDEVEVGTASVFSRSPAEDRGWKAIALSPGWPRRYHRLHGAAPAIGAGRSGALRPMGAGTAESRQ